MKKQSRKVAKRCLAFLMVLFLLSINSFAAVVSDNDGSAFITKAEFDSLKNSFQSQIDSYNKSIDTKIDGAITSYLAGIRIAVMPEDLWSRVTAAVGGKLEFLNNVPGSGTATEIPAAVNVNGTVNLVVRDMARGLPGDDYKWFSYWRAYADEGNTHFQLNFGTSNPAVWPGYNRNAYYITWRDAGNPYADFQQGKVDTAGAWEMILPPTDAIQFDMRVKVVQENVESHFSTWNSISTNSGSVWEYHEEPTGILSLDKYYTNYVLQQNIELYVKDYKNFPWATQANFNANYVNASQRNITGTNTIAMASSYNFGDNTVGTKITGTGTDVGNYSNNNIVKIAVDNAIDYKMKQWGNNTASAINVIGNTQLPVLKENKTETQALTYDTWYNNWAQGVTDLKATYKSQKYTYPKLTMKVTNKKLNQFANSYLTNIVGETVFLGGGAPIVRTFSEGQKITFTGIFREVNASGTTYTTANNISFCISDGQFKDGAIDTANGKTNITGWLTATGGSTKTFEIPVSATNTVYWINMYSKTSGRKVWLENLTMTVH